MNDDSGPDGTIDGGKVHSLPIRVYHEDTDLTGVVYHANYLRFLERGRSDFLRAIGVTHALLRGGESPVGFAVTRMEIDFLRPARLEDLLTVRTVFRPREGAMLRVAQTVERGAETLVRAELMVACVTLDGRAARPPKVLVNAVASYEGGVLKST
jgi:acyl-CoA thioester hydrolase